MRYIWLIILLPILVVNSFSQDKNLKLIQDIKINNLNPNNYEVFSVELFTKKNQKIGKHKCVNLQSLVKTNDENILLEVIDINDKKYYITGNEIDKEISQQPPLLFIDDVISNLGDTLVIAEEDFSDLENNQLLNSELSSVTNFRLYVALDKWSKKMTNMYLKPSTIVFPVDKSTKRWVVGAKRIKVYKLD